MARLNWERNNLLRRVRERGSALAKEPLEPPSSRSSAAKAVSRGTSTPKRKGKIVLSGASKSLLARLEAQASEAARPISRKEVREPGAVMRLRHEHNHLTKDILNLCSQLVNKIARRQSIAVALQGAEPAQALHPTKLITADEVAARKKARRLARKALLRSKSKKNR